MCFEDAIDLLSITVPFITAVLLAWINNRTSKKQIRTDALHKRFDEFYFPFYKKYISLNLYSKGCELSHMDLQIIGDFTFLCIDNMYLMDSNSQKYVPLLYTAYLNLIEIKSDISTILDFEHPLLKDYDNIFNPLAKSVFEEYKDICNKLQLPKPAF
ncbi:hypothetical protein DWX89_09240 [Coprobacillus sp. AF21-8LB]|nr:hypothetical protein DWX89_09240 [Coprobacillus sp. AF21-8LB]